MSGMVILSRARCGVAPRFCAASSRRRAGLLEPGDGGAHDVGQPADCVGEDEDENRIAVGDEEVEDLALGREREVSEREHQPGDGERQHRDRVERMTPGNLRAHDDVGDRDTQHEVDESRQRRILQRVADRWHGQFVPERVVEMLKC